MLDDLERRVKRIMRAQNMDVDTATELALADPQAGTGQR